MQFCPTHKTREVRPGKKRCQLCADSYTRFVAKHREAGKCLCGGIRVEGFRKCTDCRKAQEIRYKNRKQAGLCLCGRPTLPNRKGCAICTEKAKRRRLNKKKAGKCQCGRTPTAGRKVCRHCLKVNLTNQIMSRVCGLCNCGRGVLPGYLSCPGCRNKANVRHARRVREDRNYAALMKIRGSLIYGIIRSKGAKKVHPTEKLLGCTVAFARKHIEQQFAPGMTWENKELWHIDHYVPCGAFNMTDERQQRLCNNWRNLRPLWEKDNLKKGSNFPPDFQERVAELEANVL